MTHNHMYWCSIFWTFVALALFFEEEQVSGMIALLLANVWLIAGKFMERG